MKKIFKYALALAALSVLATSCKNDEDMIFDSSAAERTDEAIADYSALLSRDGGKWIMEYFASEDERGQVFAMTFSSDGSVDIAASNNVNGYTYQSENSLWSIKADDGVIISFDTYNPVFHVFSEPQGSNDGGHGGDYEFLIIRASEDGNTLELKGKRNRLPIMMYRMSADTDLEAIVRGNADAAQNMFSSAIDHLIITTADGYQFTVLDAPYGVLGIYPTDGDAITQTVYGSILFTSSGIRFIEPFEVATADGGKVYTFYQFTLQPDGSLLQTDGYGSSIIAADALSYLFSFQNWSLATAKSANEEQNSGHFASDIVNITDQFEANRGQLSKIEFLSLGLVDVKDEKGEVMKDEQGNKIQVEKVKLLVTGRFRSGASYRTQEMGYTFTVTRNTADTVTLSELELDSNGKTYYDRFSALKDFVDSFLITATLSCDNVMAPTPVVFTAPDGSYLTLTAK